MILSLLSNGFHVKSKKNNKKEKEEIGNKNQKKKLKIDKNSTKIFSSNNSNFTLFSFFFRVNFVFSISNIYN